MAQSAWARIKNWLKNGLREIVIYPFLIAIYIVLDPISHNFVQVLLLVVYRPLEALLIVTAILLIIFRLITRNWHRAGFVTFITLFLFFSYGHVLRIVQVWFSLRESVGMAWFVLVVWIAILILFCSRLIWGNVKDPRRLTLFGNAVLLIAITMPLFRILAGFFPGAGDQTGYSKGNASPISDMSLVNLSAQVKPDIYYIILDGYTRQDVLNDLYSYDNSEFLAQLEQRGFFVARQSYSNYHKTVFSLTSSLNFSYLDTWSPPGKNGAGFYRYLYNEFVDNRVFTSLQGIGYKIVSFDSGYEWTWLPDTDLYLSYYPLQITYFEQLVLASTPIEPFSVALRIPMFNYKTHRQRVVYTFNELQKMPEIAGPKFVFAHIISPHPPFVFDHEGNPG